MLKPLSETTVPKNPNSTSCIRTLDPEYQNNMSETKAYNETSITKVALTQNSDPRRRHHGHQKEQ